MALDLELDYLNRIVTSKTSILDGLEFHAYLRDIEASMFGILYPVIHTYAAIDIGGGAIFPAIAFINGWTLQFPAGNFNISGFNLDADINPVNDCYVERMQSAAYAVTAVGGTGLSSSDIEAVAAEVLATLNATTIPVNTAKIAGVTVAGTGTESDPWGPA
jgi:hypothetical protein